MLECVDTPDRLFGREFENTSIPRLKNLTRVVYVWGFWDRNFYDVIKGAVSKIPFPNTTDLQPWLTAKNLTRRKTAVTETYLNLLYFHRNVDWEHIRERPAPISVNLIFSQELI